MGVFTLHAHAAAYSLAVLSIHRFGKTLCNIKQRRAVRMRPGCIELGIFSSAVKEICERAAAFICLMQQVVAACCVTFADKLINSDGVSLLGRSAGRVTCRISKSVTV